MTIFLLLLITWVILLIIILQDYKDRKVYWFLYPLFGLLVLSIQMIHNNIYAVVLNCLINFLFVITLLLFASIYSRIRIKKHLINESIGLGDIFFFVAISFAFAPISFLILFVFSLLFSLSLHLFLNSKKNDITVPLAGHMALFFGIVYLIVFLTKDFSLFAY